MRRALLRSTGQKWRELLAEPGVLQGDPGAARPTYDERYLCGTPQERVYRHGLWQEGLLPPRGLDIAERDQRTPGRTIDRRAYPEPRGPLALQPAAGVF